MIEPIRFSPVQKLALGFLIASLHNVEGAREPQYLHSEEIGELLQLTIEHGRFHQSRVKTNDHTIVHVLEHLLDLGHSSGSLSIWISWMNSFQLAAHIVFRTYAPADL